MKPGEGSEAPMGEREKGVRTGGFMGRAGLKIGNCKFESAPSPRPSP